MEPGVAAVAYTAESAVEGAIATSIAISRPTMPLKANFSQIANVALPRSSHSLSVVKGRAYVFGGEVEARVPEDSDMHMYTLPSSGVADADYKYIPADEFAPPPRVGHTAATVSDAIFIFGGRGGKDMTPLEEKGRVWAFNTLDKSWSHIDPVEGSAYPAARSYHAATSTQHPLPVHGSATVLSSSTIYDHGTIFIHGGCPTSGRTADVWSFDIAARTWSQLPDAPGPARGGAALTVAQSCLYRFGGFDGSHELGGQLDYLKLSKATFDDKAGKGELEVVPTTGKWESFAVRKEAQGPGPRSVAGLHPITTGQGRSFLVLLLGEREPSSSGHDTAGKFWSDVWAFQLSPEDMTAASIKDATRKLFGAKSTEKTWAQVEIDNTAASSADKPGPGPRGWFASAVGEDVDNGSIVLWGGIDADNSRLGDGWTLNFTS